MCQYLENQALMEEAALEHEGQGKLFHYCYYGDRKCVSISKSLLHSKEVPKFLLHVNDHIAMYVHMFR